MPAQHVHDEKHLGPWMGRGISESCEGEPAWDAVTWIYMSTPEGEACRQQTIHQLFLHLWPLLDDFLGARVLWAIVSRASGVNWWNLRGYLLLNITVAGTTTPSKAFNYLVQGRKDAFKCNSHLVCTVSPPRHEQCQSMYFLPKTGTHNIVDQFYKNWINIKRKEEQMVLWVDM